MRVFKYCVWAFVFTLSSLGGFSQQQKINSAKLIEQGTALYNKDKYKEAIEIYKMVPRTDTNYSIILYNLSLSYYADSNFTESKRLAEQGVKSYPEKADEWYNLIANALDNLDKHAEAVSFYDKITDRYHNKYLAWYNKGITYYNRKQLSNAKKCFEKCALINPYYAPVHYYLGKVAFDEGNMVAAMLSLSTNLLVNPANKYNGLSIKLLNNIAKVTDDVAKNAAKYTSSSADYFDLIQEIVLSKIALDPQYKLKADLEDAIVRQLQVIFEKLSYNSSDTGFYNQYYAPLYAQTLTQERFEPFVFYIFSSVNISSIEKYVKKNKKEIDNIVPWFTAYLSNIRETQVLNVADRKNVTQKVNYSNGVAWGKGATDGRGDKAILTGQWEFYYENGQLKSKGSFSQKQEKTGDWDFYYQNGSEKEKTSYKDSKAEGKSLAWYDNGTPYLEEFFKEGELEGVRTEYYYNGLIKKTETYKKGKKDGPAKAYTSYGTLDYTTNYVNDKEDGDEINLYKNGKLKYRVSYKNGEAAGLYKKYFLDGVLSMEGNFLNGKRAGEWKEYYNSGNVKVTSNYNAGELEGVYKEYFWNGQLAEQSVYVKDKLEGKYENFDYDGKLYSESVYEKGRLRELKFFDKAGKVTSTSSSRSGAGNLVFYDAEGNKTSEGYFTKDGLRSGKSTFYYRSGKVRTTADYKDGLLNGEKLTWYKNGQLAEKTYYKEDEENGYQATYYENGNLKHEGEVVKGLYEGMQTDYNVFGNVYSKINYKGGDAEGFAEYYHQGGKLDFEQSYTAGWVTGVKEFDTTGKVLADLEYPRGEGELHFKNYTGTKYITAAYQNHYLNGVHTILFADGTPCQITWYKHGVKDSLIKKFYLGGKTQYEGKYKMNEKDGKWNYYHENGQLQYTETYNNGRLNGMTKLYNKDGTIDKEMPYTEGELDGEDKIYGENGQLAVIINYRNGSIISYTYEDKSGKLIPVIPLKNETGTVTAYYKNGTKSVEMEFNEGEIDGRRNIYFTNGKPYVEGGRLLGYDNGTRKVYSTSGSVENEEHYYYGNLNGVVKKYWHNGKLQSEENWYNGELHDITKNFDENGKLIQTLTYYYGTLQKIQ